MCSLKSESVGVYLFIDGYMLLFYDALTLIPIGLAMLIPMPAMVAYIVIMAGYLTAIDSINDFFYMELFSRGLTVPVLGVAVLYGVNVFFGLLPIFTLLRKTPSEILVKYDI